MDVRFIFALVVWVPGRRSSMRSGPYGFVERNR